MVWYAAGLFCGMSVLPFTEDSLMLCSRHVFVRLVASCVMI